MEDQYRKAAELTKTEQRALMFQLLYALYGFDYEVSLDEIIQKYNHWFMLELSEDSEVAKMVKAIADDREALDKQIIPLLENWRYDRLGISTILILRLGVWELIHTETDAAVVINEAVELAKCFGEKDSFKFINGVLDQFVKRSADQ